MCAARPSYKDAALGQLPIAPRRHAESEAPGPVKRQNCTERPDREIRLSVRPARIELRDQDAREIMVLV